MQIAYLVEDMDRALSHWTKTLGVGPFFLLEHAVLHDARYRGKPTDVDLTLALAYSGAIDPLCDEGKTYADRLVAAGVSAEYKCYENTIHGFATFSGAIDLGKDALALIGRRLRELLGEI